jgi:D-alanine transaminase
MKELIWLNGQIMPLADARVSVEDRGFQFADGVYEVVRVYGGKAFAMDLHMDRLERSCGGISLTMPLGKAELAAEMNKLVAESGMKEGMIYLQLTRGTAPRSHVVEGKCKPTLLFYVRQLPPVHKPGTAPGAKLISVQDERWSRCWVKSIALLPNILAKHIAHSAGADEAVFVQNGIVTECCSSNFLIVIRGQVLTHPVGPKVLPGITRQVLFDVASKAGIPMIERPVFEAEAIAADEVFITSTTREVGWVRQWNGRTIGQGKCGPVTLKLGQALYELTHGS